MKSKMVLSNTNKMALIPELPGRERPSTIIILQTELTVDDGSLANGHGEPR